MSNYTSQTPETLINAIKVETDKITDVKVETDKISDIKTETDKISATITEIDGIKTETDKIPATITKIDGLKTETDKISEIIDEIDLVKSDVTEIKDATSYLFEYFLTPSDNIQKAFDGVITGNYTEFTKLRSYKIPVHRIGSIRISFAMKVGTSGNTVHGRIYKNGTPVGTEQTTGATSYQTFSEDFDTWVDGDSFELWAYITGGTLLVREFRFMCDETLLDCNW